MKRLLLTGIAVLLLATSAAHAEELITRRGVEWKCHDGVTVRFDQVGEKREEGSSETLTITGLHNFRKLHITCGNRGCPVLNGRRCVIQD
jgi:hypothetical protein